MQKQTVLLRLLLLILVIILSPIFQSGTCQETGLIFVAVTYCPCTFAQSPSNEMCEGIVRSMTPPSKRVQPLMPPEVRWVQVGLQHGERQLQMKYMFLNLALNGSEVESPVNMSHSTGQDLEDPRL